MFDSFLVKNTLMFVGALALLLLLTIVKHNPNKWLLLSLGIAATALILIPLALLYT
jgi:membrane-bound ClpP family serine protease